MTRRKFIGTSIAGIASGAFGYPTRGSLGARGQQYDKDDVLPYDAEVEWLESTGMQWINTEVYADNYTSIYSRAMCMSDTTGKRTLLGARENGEAASAVCYLYTGNSNVRWDNKIALNPYATALSPHDVAIGSFGYTVDGYNVVLNSSLSGKCKYPIYIFGYNNNGIGAGSAIRMWNLSIYHRVKQIANYLPVRFTNEHGFSEGAMYDRITGELFRNAGSGAFIIGPDV